MRSDRVFTNYRCNQNCTYCTLRRASDDLASIQADAVRARILAVKASGASELVLSGGEPTLRADLPALVAHAASLGLEVALETNGTRIGADAARALAAAGLSRAIVNLAGVDETLDVVTRDPGGFARTRSGLLALLDAGVAVEVSAVIVRSTRDQLPALPALLASWSLRADRWKGLVVSVPVESPERGELLSYEEVVPVVLALETSARHHGIPIRLGNDAPPPCVFPPRAKVQHLFALTRGGSARDDRKHLLPCAGCLVAESCSGLSVAYLERHGVPEMRPVAEERVRRRLSIISTVEEQMVREFVTPNRMMSPVHGVIEEDIIRVQFRCNQACTFCFVSTHLPPMGDDAVRAAILSSAARNRKITLSGGEPTLHPKLVEYVQLAKQHSKLPVQLQTNAIRLDDARLVDALADAKLDEAFVSLHGTTAEVSDAVTEAPGTFARTIVGIDELHRTSIELMLNFVICQTNLHQLRDYIALIAERWPRAYVNISFVAPSSDVVPRDVKLVPRYADALPLLAEAIADATRLGLRIGGFESMCGIPLCLVPTSLEGVDIAEVPDGFDRGEFVKAEACASCRMEGRCYGLRRGYEAMHGSSELRPFRTYES